jgi:ferredoxin
VTQPDERSVHGLRIVIDREQCVGFGDCVEAAPDAFALDAESVAVFVNPAAVEPSRLLGACDACPVDAITVHDEHGMQLVPAPSKTPSPKSLRPGV